ncbi:MAG: hypothetical protein ACRCU3_03435, partial [Eubacteriaceae bacterium]
IGIVGDGQSQYEIKSCTNTKTIWGGNNVGGIVGNHAGVITGDTDAGAKTKNSGEIVNFEGLFRFTGGIVGRNGGKIENATNTGNVSGQSDVGGFVGYGNSFSRIDLKNCVLGDNTGSSLIKIEGDYNSVGGIIGENDGIINNINGANLFPSEVQVTGGYDSVGGIAGRNVTLATGEGVISAMGSQDIENISIETVTKKVSVKGPSRVGGIVGYNAGGIVNCISNAGKVEAIYWEQKADYGVGGVVGENQSTKEAWQTVTSNGNIVKCINKTENITGNMSVGGIAGISGSSQVARTLIKECQNEANLNIPGGFYALGGIVGTNTGDVQDSRNFGGITGTNATQSVGGIVGYNYNEIPGPTITAKITEAGLIKGCQNLGNVIANSNNAGGIVGYNEANPKITALDGTTSATPAVVYCTNGDISGDPSSNGKVTSIKGTNNVGGIAGTNNGTIGEFVVLNTQVNGRSNVGGAVGNVGNDKAIVQEGYFVSNSQTSPVIGTGSFVGGMVGNSFAITLKDLLYIAQAPTVNGLRPISGSDNNVNGSGNNNDYLSGDGFNKDVVSADGSSPLNTTGFKELNAASWVTRSNRTPWRNGTIAYPYPSLVVVESGIPIGNEPPMPIPEKYPVTSDWPLPPLTPAPLAAQPPPLEPQPMEEEPPENLASDNPGDEKMKNDLIPELPDPEAPEALSREPTQGIEAPDDQ